MAATAADVQAFLGRSDAQTLALAQVDLPLVTEFVRAYTRGVGFDTDGNPDAALSAVITTATARLVQNPTSVKSATTGTESRSFTVFDGFNLVEQIVLNNYRRRAA